MAGNDHPDEESTRYDDEEATVVPKMIFGMRDDIDETNEGSDREDSVSSSSKPLLEFQGFVFIGFPLDHHISEAVGGRRGVGMSRKSESA